MLRWIITLSALGLLAGGAAAGDKPKGERGKGDGAALFRKIDANGDGKLSKEEFAKLVENVRNKRGEASKGKAKGPEAIFARLDADKDGYVSADEFQKLRELMGKRKQGK